MARRGPHTTALPRLLIATTLCVVASFLSVAVIARWTSRKIDTIVSDIVDDAMPRVRHLSSARGAVRELGVDAERLVREPAEAAASAAVRERLRADVATASAAVEQYVALRALAEEAPPRDRLLADFSELRVEVAVLLEAVAAGDPNAAEQSLLTAQAGARRVDETLQALIDRDAVHGADLALSIRRMRAETRHVVVGLDAACVALALFATALSVLWLRRALRALEDAHGRAEARAAALEARLAELDQFAGRAAHDLLSPLSAPVYALDVLRRERPEDARLQGIVQRGLSGLGRAREVVDGLLDFARAGAPRDENASARVPDVLEDCIAAVREDAVAAKVGVGVEHCDPCTVACSPGVLTSLLGNLLRNAVKHMGEAPIREVCVRVGALGDAGRCRVEVVDTGPGVSEALAVRMFEPFVRGPTSATGVGLGLATVKRLAGAHGGDAGYERRSSRSCFWIELPTVDRVPPAARRGGGL